MTPLSLIGGGVAGLTVLIPLLYGKLRRHAIRQNRIRLGSALLSEAVAPGAWRARFLIIHGEAAFQEHEPFERGGATFETVPVLEADARSTVLRRFTEATCRVLRVDALA